MIPADWLNVARYFQRVEEGDPISVEVQGGWVRRPAPCAGTVLETVGGLSFFLPEMQGEEESTIAPETPREIDRDTLYSCLGCSTNYLSTSTFPTPCFGCPKCGEKVVLVKSIVPTPRGHVIP